MALTVGSYERIGKSERLASPNAALPPRIHLALLFGVS
jgi:hypothetical protein